MKEIIVYLTLSSICVAIFTIVYRVFLRGSTSFVFNRVYLTFGLITSFILPTIRLTYEVTVEKLIAETSEVTQIPTVAEGNSLNIWIALFFIYTLGILVQIFRNAISYRHLYHLIRDGERSKSDSYVLIHNEKIKSPFSFYRFIVMNQQKLSDTENDLILKHEITHVLQKHWIDLLGCECALAIQWFNPFMWLYLSYVKENHEFLADQAVLNQGVPLALYQAVLVNQKFEGSVFSFSNSFNYSHKLNRLTMMKKTKTSRWRKIAVLTLVPAFGLFFWASAKPTYIVENETKKLNIESQEPKKDIFNALILIDGVESSKAEMDNLDPAKVESVTVLKDESAIELYGEKGKNGVILITTKK